MFGIKRFFKPRFKNIERSTSFSFLFFYLRACADALRLDYLWLSYYLLGAWVLLVKSRVLIYAIGMRVRFVKGAVFDLCVCFGIGYMFLMSLCDNINNALEANVCVIYTALREISSKLVTI